MFPEQYLLVQIGSYPKDVMHVRQQIPVQLWILYQILTMASMKQDQTKSCVKRYFLAAVDR